MYQNHVIDPTYFYDAIEEFAFNFEWYPCKGTAINELGKRSYTYDNQTIRGSLQSQGTNLRQNVNLNTEDMQYRFYCKSLYRISIGDFIKYKNRYLRVSAVRDYDEYGVRSCTLQMVNLVNYKDFQLYLKYLEGQVIV
nr:MAG TPA: head-tail joining protein [Caudoviricetes sp.]